jgi:hypothetical protein
MSAYRVTFVRKLTNVRGEPAQAEYRAIGIELARDPERAVAAAKKRFARLEGVTHWRLRADYVDIDEIAEAGFVHGSA